MKTDELISNLASTLTPVRRLKPPGVRMLFWLLISTLYVGLGITFFGVRADFRTKLLDAQFLLDTVAILAVSIASAGTAFYLSVPGRKEDGRLSRIVWLSAAFWTAYFVLSMFIQSAHQGSLDMNAGAGRLCVESIFELGIVPAVCIFIMIRKAAPLELGKAGAFSMLAAVALAGFATQWICQYDFPLHFLVWHVLPITTLSVLGIVLGKRFFRRPGR